MKLPVLLPLDLHGEKSDWYLKPLVKCYWVSDPFYHLHLVHMS